MIYTGITISNPFSLPYINPNFGTSGSSGSSGTGGTGGTGGGSAVNFTQIRFEGGSTTSGTVGASNCIYEIYLFVNGQVELRLGNWANTGGVSGHYTSGGTGTSFSPVANTTYVWGASGVTTTFYSAYQYINGALSASGSAAPSLGAASTGTWPPSGWTSLQNGSVDDSFVNVPITSTNFFGTARTIAYVGSNCYITFGNGSTNYASLSTTNPNLDKFMFNAADRSYQRVAYRTGSK
jgi:hypothetical protein